MQVDQVTHNGILKLICSFFTTTDILGGVTTLVIRSRKYTGHICTPRIHYQLGDKTRTFRLTQQNWQFNISAVESLCARHLFHAAHMTQNGAMIQAIIELSEIYSTHLYLSKKQWSGLFYANVLEKQQHNAVLRRMCPLFGQFKQLQKSN